LNTLVEVFRAAAAAGRIDALSFRLGENRKTVSSDDLGVLAREIAGGLIRAGVRPSDRVAILSENRPEWIAADFGAACAGAISVPIYSGASPADIEHCLRDSGAAVAFAGTPADLGRILDCRERCASLRLTVLLQGNPPGVERLASLAGFTAAGREFAGNAPGAVSARMDGVKDDDLATIVYSPGTEGGPKGVMLTHGNVASAMDAVRRRLAAGPDDLALSLLPLPQVFERILDGALLSAGAGIAFPDSRDWKSVMSEIRPTVLHGVPRHFEQLAEDIRDRGDALPGFRGKIFRRSLDAGRELVERREAGKDVNPLHRLLTVAADRLVFSALRDRLGGRLRYGVCEGSSVDPETADLFWAAGVPVYEGYGLAEAGSFVSLNSSDEARLGSAGRPLAGVRVRLGPEDEILLRGPGVMEGYWNRPEDTAAAFTPDRWLRSGDIGRVDEQGFLHVVGRRADVLVSAYGKAVAPAPLETALRATPFVAAAMAVGDREKFVAALIVPRFDRLEPWARERSVAFSSPAQLCANPRVKTLFQDAVDTANRGRPREEQIRKFALLNRDFGVETGELSPALSLRRREATRIHRETIAAIYEWAAARALVREPPPDARSRGTGTDH
jgi:long-chain acyl-CoA synthetase